MGFSTLLKLISDCANDSFLDATEKLNNHVVKTSSIEFIDIITQIGAIPEAIIHDSSEEKIFSKVSDMILSRAFHELGLKSTVITERANSADVIAQSRIYEYSLVADAKAFRLSRTAKNQKDFKITALSGWRKNDDYAVLCSPYFQYPQNRSQIYAQALNYNVCLLSWEHIIFLLSHNIKEDENINLSNIWNFSAKKAQSTTVAENKKSFIGDFDLLLVSLINADLNIFKEFLGACTRHIKIRGDKEKSFLENERKKILGFSREEAIAELIKSKKIEEKIRQIDSFVRGISRA